MRDPTDETAGALRKYLREIEKAPLLNPEQESALVQKVKAGVYAKRQLDSGRPTSETVEKLRVQARDGERARQRLIESSLRLVVHVAREFQQRGVPLLDLIQEGNIGLIRAVEGFDPADGSSFSTIAARSIRQAILNAIGDEPQLP